VREREGEGEKERERERVSVRRVRDIGGRVRERG